MDGKFAQDVTKELYRTDKKNVTTLIGASEWDYAILNCTHEYDVMDNTKKKLTTGGEC